MASIPLPMDRPGRGPRRADPVSSLNGSRPAAVPPRESGELILAYGQTAWDLAALRREQEALERERKALERERKAVGRKRQAEAFLRPWQVELLKLQAHVEKKQMRMIVIFEGRDAAGKGGAIRRITRFMNEKHYRVIALGRPTAEQRLQWYFQRYVAQFPTGGEIVLFDRSWYCRAMVEPVFGFCTPEEYRTFMQGVTTFERDLVRQGIVLVKLYFSVTREEQARRFERRRTDPLRQWKLSEIDVQAQDRWDEFTQCKYDMLRRTSTRAAPWVIVRSDNKQRARLNTVKVVLNAVDYAGRRPDLEFAPDPRIVLSGADEVALMEAERRSSGKFGS